MAQPQKSQQEQIAELEEKLSIAIGALEDYATRDDFKVREVARKALEDISRIGDS